MKKLLALLLTACMLLSLAACGGSSSGSSNAPAETTQSQQAALENQENLDALNDIENADNTYIRDSITLAWATATSLTCWGTNNDTPGNYEVYEMLYECDAKGQVYPLLADGSYEGTLMPGCDHEDGTGVYTVKIYDYIYDHNGNHVTAEDVAYSFMYQFENETTSGWGDLISVEAADETTVVFTFSEDQDGLGELNNILCRCFIVDEESHKASASGLATEMCGTGPYKFVSYTSGSTLVLERNDNYWQKEELIRQEQQANVQTITYQFIDESAQRVIALQTGTVEYVHELDSDNARKFADGGENADQYNVYTYQSKFVYYLTPNCSDSSICSDLNMRLAILNAVDQDGLVTALGGTGSRLYCYATGYYSDYDFVDWGSLDNYNTRTGVDFDQVKSYLNAAGYNGETVKIVTTSNMSDCATIIAAQLANAGINAEVSALDQSSFNATIAEANAWDISLGMMAGDYNVTVWLHGFSWGNTGDGNHTTNFVYDQEWEDLLNECCTGSGHTEENMAKWWQMAVDNGYAMGLYTTNIYDIIPEDMTYSCLGDKLTPLLGACTYAAP